MRYFTGEDLEEIRRIDLLTYLRTCEPWELVRRSHDVYTTKTHDSLIISNGKWMWFSQGIGGYSALDYLIKVQGYPFLDAVKILKEQVPGMPAPTFSEKKKKKLLLPEKAENSDKVREYLMSRGISPELINYCIEKGLIYESEPNHNVIFLGFDKEGTARYAAYRATDGSRVMGDAAGSDKSYSFRIMNEESNTLHLFESAIDLLSFMTLEKMKGISCNESYVSLAGIYRVNKWGEIKFPAALKDVLGKNTKIEKIHFHFDRDQPGIDCANAFCKLFGERFEVTSEPPPFAKDYNEYLCRIVEERKDWRNENVDRNDRGFAR